MKKKDLILFEKLEDEIDSFMTEFLSWFSSEIYELRHSYYDYYSVDEGIICIRFQDKFGDSNSIRVPLDVLFYTEEQRNQYAIAHKAEREKAIALKKQKEELAKKEAKEKREMEEYQTYLALKEKYESKKTECAPCLEGFAGV